MLKSYDIENTLEQIEDYAAFYENDDNEVNEEEKEERERELLGVFENEREKMFYNYGDDMEFVRYHKRTTRNF